MFRGALRNISIVCFMLCPMLCAAAQEQAKHIGPRPAFDGRWWLSISDSERSGVLSGYLDCYSNEYKGSGRFLTKAYDRYRDLVTKLYHDDASLGVEKLPSAIYRLRDKPGEKPEYPAGEPVAGAHEGNDGLYWRQANQRGHAEQLGFVEGYLLCHEKLADSRGGVFSKSPEEYRGRISRWYRYDEAADAIDPVREHEAIATVLFKVRSIEQ
jgi:hypothetical protein